MKIPSKKLWANYEPVLCAVLAIYLLSPLLPAQTFYGSIVGAVTDPSGGVVQRASVRVTNLGTSETRAAETDSSGSYRFVSLVPGRYRLEVEMTNFKRLSREPIAVEVNATVRIDAMLEIGAVSETVQVTAATPLLQSESTSISQVVEGRHVLEMPLNGRNPMQLIALVPGVVAGTGSVGTAALGNQTSGSAGGHSVPANWGNFMIGGGIGGYSAMFLDGVPLNLGGRNEPGLVFAQDAIQEFRVESNNVSAEFGRFGGGVVNMTTKSGINAFHGSAYEFFRNTVLNANDYFSNMSHLPRAPFHQNQYGVTLGGPVLKNKTFFFFSWEGYNKRYGIPYLNFVPTIAQRAGDFSASLGASTGVINPCTGQPVLRGQIFDPLTTKTVNGQNCRSPFPDNKIPANRIDNTANVMANGIKYWPAPNVSLAGGNYQSTPKSGGDQGLWSIRIDQNLSDKQRIFGRFSYANLSEIPFNPTLNMNGNPSSNPNMKNVVVGDTYAFSSTTVLDVRLSYLRQYNDDMPMSLGTDLAQFGPAWASLNNLVTYKFLPQATVSGLIPFRPQTIFSQTYSNNYVGSASVTKVLRRHTLKFGGEVRLMDQNRISTQVSSGSFTFNSGFSSSDGSASATTGAPFASFMLGYPAQGSIGDATWTGAYAWYQGYYITDTAQIGKRLTLNVGVRWELPGALAERHDLATVFLPTMADPNLQSSSLKPNGVLALVKSSQWPDRTIEELKRNLFAPRVGFVYRITDQFVVRSGYGITHLPAAFNTDSPSNSPINAAVTAMTTSVNNANLVPYNTLSIPFPAGNVPGTIQQSFLRSPGRSTSFLSSLLGGTINSVEPEQPYPYMQQWNMNVEYQLKGNMLLEVGYVGSKGTHLPISGAAPNTANLVFNVDQLPNQFVSMGADLVKSVPNPFYGLIPSSSSLGKPTILQGQLLRPFPQYVNVVSNGMHLGTTSYHSMQVKTEKRFGTGGILMLNYTWAKILGNVDSTLESSSGSTQDFSNLRGERALLSIDTRHRFVGSWVYDFPFGKGRRYLSGMTGIVDKLISGWSINGTAAFQSGFPLFLTAQATTLSTSFGAGVPRPNVVAGCDPNISGSAQSRIGKWFNTACFTQPGPYSFGNEGRADAHLKASGVNNWDFAFAKATSITERVGLQFRGEIFNTFNRVQFAMPATALGVSSFGTVSRQQNQPRTVQFALRLTF